MFFKCNKYVIIKKLGKKSPKKSIFIQPQSMTTQKLPGNQWNLPPAKTAKLMLILRIIGYPLTYNVYFT